MDVVFHCKGNKKLNSNKIVLALGSEFLRKIFSELSDCCNTAFDLVKHIFLKLKMYFQNVIKNREPDIYSGYFSFYLILFEIFV